MSVRLPQRAGTRRRGARLRPRGDLGAPVALALLLGACGSAPPTVADTLRAACTEARQQVAAAPEPADRATEAAFMAASRDATRAVARVADDLATRGDDRTVAHLAWQLYRFPIASGRDDVLATAHEAGAAILRIDGLARALGIGTCGAGTWRPAAWRAIAERRGARPDDAAFRRELARLCAATFPEPALLDDGVPLLAAMVAAGDAGAGGGDGDGDLEVKRRVVARLNSVTARPSATSAFVSDFSNELPRLRPSAALEDGYTALLAAFLHLDAAVPHAMPRDPPPHVREPVYAALDELQQAWEALGVTC